MSMPAMHSMPAVRLQALRAACMTHQLRCHLDQLRFTRPTYVMAMANSESPKALASPQATQLCNANPSIISPMGPLINVGLLPLAKVD